MISSNKQALKTALVTGGARRIGASIVKTLHQAGFNVVIHCHHSLSAAQLLAKELNKARKDSAWVIAGDLHSPVFVSDIIPKIIVQFGRLDVLVNNASLFIRTPKEAYDFKTWEALFAVNVLAPSMLSRMACSYLSLNHGSIINITDIHANTPLKDYSVYCQTKAALTMQTKALAKEFAPHIRVNAVAPGAMMWPEESNALDLKIKEKILNETPLKMHGHPDFIAQSILFLVNHNFITGHILSIDGGRSI